jgi:hypothetical protein
MVTAMEMGDLRLKALLVGEGIGSGIGYHSVLLYNSIAIVYIFSWTSSYLAR